MLYHRVGIFVRKRTDIITRNYMVERETQNEMKIYWPEVTRDSRSDFSPVKVETVAPGPAGYLLEVGGGELANLLAVKLGEVVEYDAVNVPDSEWGGEHGQNITGLTQGKRTSNHLIRT